MQALRAALVRHLSDRETEEVRVQLVPENLRKLLCPVRPSSVLWRHVNDSVENVHDSGGTKSPLDEAGPAQTSTRSSEAVGTGPTRRVRKEMKLRTRVTGRIRHVGEHKQVSSPALAIFLQVLFFSLRSCCLDWVRKHVPVKTVSTSSTAYVVIMLNQQHRSLTL